MDHPPRAIAQHLHFDMATAGDIALQVDPRIAECSARLRRRQLEGSRQFRQRVDTLHATPAAAADRFDEQRHTNGPGRRQRLIHHGHGATGHHRHLGGLGLRSGPQLVADRLDLRGGRSDEDDAGGFTQSRQRGTLREEAIAG